MHLHTHSSLHHRTLRDRILVTTRDLITMTTVEEGWVVTLVDVNGAEAELEVEVVILMTSVGL